MHSRSLPVTDARGLPMSIGFSGLILLLLLVFANPLGLRLLLALLPIALIVRA